MAATIKKQGYRFAVAWIAINDEPTDRNIESIRGYISTCLVADIFGKNQDEVAKAILQVRREIDIESARRKDLDILGPLTDSQKAIRAAMGDDCRNQQTHQPGSGH